MTDTTGQRARIHSALGRIAASPFPVLPLTMIVVARSISEPIFLVKGK